MPEEIKEPENTGINQGIRDEKGRFREGVSGNPAGKPPGAKNRFSFVNYWQKRWEENPEEFEELANSFMKDEKLRGLIIQMIDGKPSQKIEGNVSFESVIEIIKNANSAEPGGDTEPPKEN